MCRPARAARLRPWSEKPPAARDGTLIPLRLAAAAGLLVVRFLRLLCNTNSEEVRRKSYAAARDPPVELRQQGGAALVVHAQRFLEVVRGRLLIHEVAVHHLGGQTRHLEQRAGLDRAGGLPGPRSGAYISTPVRPAAAGSGCEACPGAPPSASSTSG